jgi:hypothetical protein
MKNKNFVLIGLLFSVSIAFTSCKKCYTCEAVDTITGEVWYAESNVCGDEEVTSFENDFNDPSVDSRARCTKN